MPDDVGGHQRPHVRGDFAGDTGGRPQLFEEIDERAGGAGVRAADVQLPDGVSPPGRALVDRDGLREPGVGRLEALGGSVRPVVQEVPDGERQRSPAILVILSDRGRKNATSNGALNAAATRATKPSTGRYYGQLLVGDGE